MLETDDLVTMARLRARLELATANIRTLEALPLPSRARAIVEISKLDVRCALSWLDQADDGRVLASVGQWLEMVESQVATVRRAITAIAVVGGTPDTFTRRSA